MPRVAPVPGGAGMRRDRISLGHGGGGELTDRLVAEVVLPRLGNPVLDRLGDAAVLAPGDGELAFTTDAFVVSPLFFPGGDIGRLAVCGTVNDLAMAGAVPLALSLAMVLEEGLPVVDLERVLDSVRAAAEEAGVPVVAGDTKVVPRGAADGMYLVTAGIGRIPRGRRVGEDLVRAGDRILVSGPIADHGLAVMLARQGEEIVRVRLESDVAPLAGLTAALFAATDGVRFLRDPTRGGVAGVVAGLAERCGLTVVLDEGSIPVRPGTRHAAEMLGIDPLAVANEGKLVAVVAPEAADAALAALRSHPLGRDAAVVGRVLAGDPIAEIETSLGGRRILRKPLGEDLPRIC